MTEQPCSSNHPTHRRGGSYLVMCLGRSVSRRVNAKEWYLHYLAVGVEAAYTTPVIDGTEMTKGQSESQRLHSVLP